MFVVPPIIFLCIVLRTEEDSQVEMALNDSTEGFKLGNMRVKFKAKDGVDEQVRNPAPMLAITLSSGHSGSTQSLRYMLTKANSQG